MNQFQIPPQKWDILNTFPLFMNILLSRMRQFIKMMCWAQVVYQLNSFQGISSQTLVQNRQFACHHVHFTLTPLHQWNTLIQMRQSLLALAWLFSLKFNRLVFFYIITHLNRCYYYAKYLVSKIFCLLSLAQMSLMYQSVFMRQPRY